MMGIEIERKFLLKEDSWRARIVRKYRIIQGYICINPEATVRIRITDHAGFLTIKGKRHNYSAAEFEYQIPPEDASAMLKQMSQHPPIDKWRHLVSYADNMWEIDEFNGANAGLTIAEIELDSAETDFELPTWLGSEISDDPRYFNANLAQNPYINWKDKKNMAR